MRSLAWLSTALLLACGPANEPTEAPPDELDIDMSRLGLIDCSERTDTGYVDGNPFTITVVTVDGKPVERDTANAYWVMQQAALNDGVQIAVVSGFRTQAEQQYLYDCYINCNCNNCNLAARPGYSNHQSGHALDLNTSSGGVLDWLNAHGADFGFSRTVPSENWHWEWWGGGPGGGPCQGCNSSCNGTVMTAPDCSTQDCALGEGTCVDDSFGVRCEPVCAALPPEGGVIDEAGSCFTAFGSSTYWRSVEGAGWDGGLLWTNAFQNDAPSNWARWQIELTEPGDYELDVYLDPAWAIYADTRYDVVHDGGTTTLSLDQSSAIGWASLGTFAFSSGASLSVFDNTMAPVAPDQHIAVDAIRLVRIHDPIPEKPDRPRLHDVGASIELSPSDPQIAIRSIDPALEQEQQDAKEVGGGCSCRASSPAPHGFAGLLLCALLFLRRRRSTAISSCDRSAPRADWRAPSDRSAW